MTDNPIQNVSDMAGQLPSKEEGKHRWVANAAFTITPSEAAAAHAGSAVALTVKNLVFYGVGCIDCEGEYHEARVHKCPAGNDWEIEE